MSVRLDALYDGTVEMLQKFESAPPVYSPLGQGKLLTENSGFLPFTHSRKRTF